MRLASYEVLISGQSSKPLAFDVLDDEKILFRGKAYSEFQLSETNLPTITRLKKAIRAQRAKIQNPG